MRISDWSSDVCSSDLLWLERRRIELDRHAISGRQQEWRRRPDCRERLDPARQGEAAFRRRGPGFRRAARGGEAERIQGGAAARRSGEHPSELQAIMRRSYAVFCLKKKNEANNKL